MNWYLNILAYCLFALCGIAIAGFAIAFWWEWHCQHINVQWPQHGVQRCNDCGRVREFAWSDEEWGYDLSRPGRWHRESNVITKENK